LSGKAKAAITSSAAFTLLEILLALALIAMMAGVLVVGAIHLTDPKPITPEDIFWKALTETRKQALLSNQEVTLRVAKGTKDKGIAFIANGPAGEARYPVEVKEKITIDFLSTQAASSAILINSQLVETQTIPFVTFYGDGTCSPFRVQFHSTGPARSIAIDPWTCAQVLKPADPNRIP
jgi:general secretion pathway protein H